jgi:hypothetical protein
VSQRTQVELEQLRRNLGTGYVTLAQLATLAARVTVNEADIATLQTRGVAIIDNTDSPYALAANVVMVLVDASAAAVTITFPAAASHTGRRVSVKRIDNGIYAITVDPNGAETIDDTATAVLEYQYESVTFVSDGTEWWIE